MSSALLLAGISDAVLDTIQCRADRRGEVSEVQTGREREYNAHDGPLDHFHAVVLAEEALDHVDVLRAGELRRLRQLQAAYQAWSCPGRARSLRNSGGFAG